LFVHLDADRLLPQLFDQRKKMKAYRAGSNEIEATLFLKPHPHLRSQPLLICLLLFTASALTRLDCKSTTLVTGTLPLSTHLN